LSAARKIDRGPCESLMDTLDGSMRAELYLGWAARGLTDAGAGRVPLRQLRDVQAALRDVRAAEVALVKQAREDGQTWQAIADALGVTRQAAWERFRDAASIDR
jgi:hypothetical protein